MDDIMLSELEETPEFSFTESPVADHYMTTRLGDRSSDEAEAPVSRSQTTLPEIKIDQKANVDHSNRFPTITRKRKDIDDGLSQSVSDEPPYAYKTDAIRRKADRKKLKAQVCDKCAKVCTIIEL